MNESYAKLLKRICATNKIDENYRNETLVHEIIRPKRLGTKNSKQFFSKPQKEKPKSIRTDTGKEFVNKFYLFFKLTNL